MWNGIYDLVEFAPDVIDKLRIPPPIHAYLLIVLLVPLIPQRFVRPFILYTGLVFLWLFMGMNFTLGVVAASAIVYAITPSLAEWARRSGRPGPATAVGWTLIHLMYLPCFFVTLPNIPGMQAGELTQFGGIGFMVLKLSQYVFDACRQRFAPVRRDQFMTFMTFLPTFRLGPIDRCQHFAEELETCKTRISPKAVSYGLARVAAGTAKMLVVAYLIEPRFFPDPYNVPFGQAFFDDAWNEPVGTVWITAYMLYFRIYLIFSGYSDGAIGMSYIMGIRTPENFRFPLACTNLIDFWRRWHMSMGTWLRDNIYIPLGGNRRRTPLALAGVFAYCGLWHFPALVGPCLFVIVHTVGITLTRKWQVRAASRGNGPARGATSLRTWAARFFGWAFTFHVLVLTVMFLLDHRHGGLRVIGRMIGLAGPAGN